jgi:aryl-alcohol dehydrogenase-like predicted oxidoreductase
MMTHVKRGFITWDLADHYGPAEDFVRLFRNQLIKDDQKELLRETKFFTKWVPRPQKITKKVVEKAVNVSRKRMGMDTLDMLQFHWWDYEDDNYIKALEYLDELREENLIHHLALTNFDTEHLEYIIDLGIPIISNQVQYSVIDRRPERKMADVCKNHKIKLLAYGTLGGGLFTERYYGKVEPRRYELNTASLQKYKNMLDRWGDWTLFQKLLITLKEIADKYAVSIANVAVRYILEQDFVGGAIIGVRLGVSEHIEENSNLFTFSLTDDDIKEIDEILKESNDLLEIIGDCGDEYR